MSILKIWNILSQKYEPVPYIKGEKGDKAEHEAYVAECKAIVDEILGNE